MGVYTSIYSLDEFIDFVYEIKSSKFYSSEVDEDSYAKILKIPEILLIDGKEYKFQAEVSFLSFDRGFYNYSLSYNKDPLCMLGNIFIKFNEAVENFYKIYSIPQ